MFFTRLRKQAKWMFLFLALVLGVGYVVFNVGGTIPGVGLGDILYNQGGSPEGTVSADEARDRIAKNPQDAQAYRDLATALQQDGQVKDAIAAYEQYLELRPRDPEVLQSVAGLYLARASRLQNQLAVAQARAQELAPARPGVTFTVKGQPVLETDPISAAATAPMQERITKLSTDIQEATTGALGAYKKLARVERDEPAHQILLAQTAEAAGEVQTAIAAYRRFIKLAPEDPNVPAIREQIKNLKQSLRQPTAG